MTLLAAALIAWASSARADDKAGGDAAATGAITGRVVDREGRPIAGAEVWGIARGATARDKVGAARTDADGLFRLAPLKEDKPVTVWADAQGFGARGAMTSTSSPAATTTSARWPCSLARG